MYFKVDVGCKLGKLLIFRSNCAPLVADMFSFLLCFFFVMFFCPGKTWLTLLRLSILHDLLNINNIYFDQMVDRIYPTEFRLNRANSSDTEAPFLDLYLCISNGTVSTEIYDERDDFDFSFPDGNVPRRTSYVVYISQLIRFARASSNLSNFHCRHSLNALTAKLLRLGYRYFKLRKAFSKFYCRHSALVEKYNVSLKTLLQQGISEPEFYGDLVYRFRKIVGKSNFSEQFRNPINRYKRIGYSLGIMRQTACLVINPIIINGYAPLLNCTTAVRLNEVGTSRYVFGLARRGSTIGFHLLWHTVELAMNTRV